MMKYIKRVLLALIAIYAFIMASDWMKSSFSDLKQEALVEKAKHNVKSRYIILVDYTKSMLSPRLWVYDTKSDEIIQSSRVSHAWSSGILYASNFSNQAGSEKSSYGSFITGGEYSGRFGKSMRIVGLEQHNNNAMSRAIVFHTKQPFWLFTTGWSLGCLMTSSSVNDEIINLTKEGTFIYVKQ
jgi:hypothetical protein